MLKKLKHKIEDTLLLDTERRRREITLKSFSEAAKSSRERWRQDFPYMSDEEIREELLQVHRELKRKGSIPSWIGTEYLD